MNHTRFNSSLICELRIETTPESKPEEKIEAIARKDVFQWLLGKLYLKGEKTLAINPENPPAYEQGMLNQVRQEIIANAKTIILALCESPNIDEARNKIIQTLERDRLTLQ
jgi:hypothetical protein